MRMFSIGFALLAATVAFAAEYKDGWNPTTLKEAVGACTDELVESAWQNTKKDAGVNPDAPLTPEIRKEIQPHIDEFNKLCDCVVRETAKKFGEKAYRANDKAIDEYALQLIEKGTCKTPKR